MSFEQIRYEVQGPVATLTLARPERLNAYTDRMGIELVAAVDQAAADDDVRVVILTGAGRGFCAGADLAGGPSSFDTRTPQGASNFGGEPTDDPGASAGATLIRTLFGCPKVLIAAFNGPAVGIGITLALPTDIKIASSEARFGFVFTRRGLVPEAASAWFLPQLVGLPQALRWCLSGHVFDAGEALNGGLVAEVVAPDRLLPRAREIAMEIADVTAPVSVALTRQMLWRFGSADGPFDLLRLDGRLAAELGASADVSEGVSAFLDRRPPNFSGRISRDMPQGCPWWTDRS